MDRIRPAEPDQIWGSDIGEDRWRSQVNHEVREDLLRLVDDLGAQPLAGIRHEDVAIQSFGPIAQGLETSLWGRSGPGFAILEGVPVDGLTSLQVERLFWAIGLHLGALVTQSSREDLMGHVQRDPTASVHRGYKSSIELNPHTDMTPMSGLLCRRVARSGGESTVVCAGAVHDAVLRESPELLAVCYQPFPVGRLNEQGPGEPGFDMYPIFARSADRIGILWGRPMITQSQEFPDAPRLTDRQIEAMDLVERTAARPELAFARQLGEGDLLLLANHRVLHSRTAFDDYDEPERRRHLLRLWFEPDLGPDVIPEATRYGYRYGRMGLRSGEVDGLR